MRLDNYRDRHPVAHWDWLSAYVTTKRNRNRVSCGTPLLHSFCRDSYRSDIIVGIKNRVSHLFQGDRGMRGGNIGVCAIPALDSVGEWSAVFNCLDRKSTRLNSS